MTPYELPPERKKELKKKNRRKVFRYLVQYAILIGIVALLVAPTVTPSVYEPTVIPATSTQSSPITQSASADDVAMNDAGFICISYSGVVQYADLDSTIISKSDFEAHMDALKASGYVTISQQDILNYYLYGADLPEKALYLVMEDGIKDTTTVVQSVLEKNNFLATACTYAENLYATNTNFLSVADCKQLLSNSYWELGSNGYRLSYINIFDRYDNYYGHLNTAQYTRIVSYLDRNYNHYLMDYLRDKDYLSQETKEEMQERLAADYQEMKDIYTDAFGYVPSMYVLMHSNTGMFGTHSQVSAQNGTLLTNTFEMNFNRQGSCYNTLASSVYDLTRMQPQAYWSTNHLLMRIWDDTGHDVAFVVGDEEAAQNWYVDEGQAEFQGDQIILTTMPYEYGRMALSSTALTDVDVQVTLEGNIVGKQAIYLRSDRNLESGICVALNNNHLTLSEIGASDVLADLDLFEFDGGSTVSEEEDELNGLMALQQAIIDYELDQDLVASAKVELARLQAIDPLTIEEGGTPYVPELDMITRDSRDIRICLEGQSISVWLDGVLVFDNLTVSTTKRGTVVLEAGVWLGDDYTSQRNLEDDVYDAVFVDLKIANPADATQVYYEYVLTEVQSIQKSIQNGIESILSFFVNHF